MNETRSNDLHNEVEALKQDLLRVRNDLKTIGEDLFERGKASAKAAKQAVGQRMDSSLETVQNCVEERPMTCVLTAFGVGLLVGGLLSLRR